MILVTKENVANYVGQEATVWNEGSEYRFKLPIHGYWDNQIQVRLARGLYMTYDNCVIMTLTDYF